MKSPPNRRIARKQAKANKAWEKRSREIRRVAEMWIPLSGADQAKLEANKRTPESYRKGRPGNTPTQWSE